MAILPSGHVVGEHLLPETLPEISVYLHIPFCSSRCNYCDFYFETTQSPRIIRATLDRIVEEARFFLTAMGRPRIRSVYVGGGTPSVVPPTLLDDFLDRLRGELFPSRSPGASRPPSGTPVEWTFEANPESVTSELLAVLTAHGVNRLSLGVQSFRDELLCALNRRADRRTVFGALETIAAARSNITPIRINVDLITGIPGQTPAMVREDIAAALDFAVDHFSIYSLTVEEHTPLKQAVDRGIRTLPPPAGQDDLWLTAQRRLLDEGFDWYEISNFALPGSRSAHNLGYWRLEPYIGLGPGGVSTIPMGRTIPGAARSTMQSADRSPARAFRLTNPNLFEYGSRFDRRWHHLVEALGPRTLLFEHFITGLRTSEGIPLRRLEDIFGVALRSAWAARLEQWTHDKIADAASLHRLDSALVLSPGARLALDRHLLEIQSWIDELPDPGRAAWPPAAGHAPASPPGPTGNDGSPLHSFHEPR